MKRREFLNKSTAYAAATAVGLGMKPRARGQGTKKPNFVVFNIDDWGWKDANWLGPEYYETPNIGRIAENSMYFTQFYVSAVCSPTRNSFVTGQNPARTGIADWRPGHQAKKGVQPF